MNGKPEFEFRYFSSKMLLPPDNAASVTGYMKNIIMITVIYESFGYVPQVLI